MGTVASPSCDVKSASYFHSSWDVCTETCPLVPVGGAATMNTSKLTTFSRNRSKRIVRTYCSPFPFFDASPQNHGSEVGPLWQASWKCSLYICSLTSVCLINHFYVTAYFKTQYLKGRYRCQIVFGNGDLHLTMSSNKLRSSDGTHALRRQGNFQVLFTLQESSSFLAQDHP